MTMRKRFAVVGTGHRATMYLDGLAGLYRDEAELVGLCDLSGVRMAWHLKRLGEQYEFGGCATFSVDEFDRMIEQTQPDTVIVCTTDATHHHYIIRAMELGCDVVTEKPMTTDADKAGAILEAMGRTGKKLQVIFNLRFTPYATKIYELIHQGVIGQVKAVDLQWTLDTSHGADYFRRWHREKDQSGGLLIHKSTHHFDLINWWVGARPQTVFAMGSLEFYGQENAQARGEDHDYERYTGSNQARDDPFAMFLDQDGSYRSNMMTGLYRNAEEETGYIRDQNVFGKGITIEDTMSVMCRYDNGVLLNYSLIAYSPWEGFRLSITGTRGRIESYIKHTSHFASQQDDHQPQVQQSLDTAEVVTVFPMFQRPYDVDIPKAEGSHGGSDPLLIEQIFSMNPPVDPYGRNASHMDGAASILVGICANHSIATGKPVDANTLLRLADPILV